MTSAIQIIVTCPCCESPFAAPSLMSTNNLGGQSTDFHARAAGADPLWFVLASCPNCGFTDYTNTIERGVQISDTTKAKIHSNLMPQVQHQKPDVAAQFVMAAQIALWEHQEASTVANHFLRAAWCSFDATQEMDYRRLACHYFEQAVEEELLSSKVRLNYMYLVGELYRRIGESQMAHQWFDQAIEFANSLNDAYADQLAALAQDQRDNPRDRI